VNEQPCFFLVASNEAGTSSPTCHLRAARLAGAVLTRARAADAAAARRAAAVRRVTRACIHDQRRRRAGADDGTTVACPLRRAGARPPERILKVGAAGGCIPADDGRIAGRQAAVGRPRRARACRFARTAGVRRGRDRRERPGIQQARRGRRPTRAHQHDPEPQRIDASHVGNPTRGLDAHNRALRTRPGLPGSAPPRCPARPPVRSREVYLRALNSSAIPDIPRVA